MLTKQLRTQYLETALSQDEFIETLLRDKTQVGLSWQDIAELLRDKYGVIHSRHWYARNYGTLIQPKDTENFNNILDLDSYQEKLLSLQKERAKLSDERTQNRAYVRRMAREETLKEIAIQAVQVMSNKKLLPVVSNSSSSPVDSKEAILIISDWHLGIEEQSALNVYNPDVAKERVAKLRDNVLSRLQKGDINRLRVVNLGDMIAGRIHLQIRLQSRYDVITQTMEVTEMIAELLSDLSVASQLPIDYYSCTDNHSRVEPDKSDSLELESLSRFTDWYLSLRLKDNSLITMHSNVYGPDIISFDCLGYNIMGVHGDKDKKTQLDRLRLMLPERYDLLLMAHLHHFWMDESNGTKIIGNGSLMGVDDYARSLRLSSKASQTMLIMSRERGCEEVRVITVQ